MARKTSNYAVYIGLTLFGVLFMLMMLLYTRSNTDPTSKILFETTSNIVLSKLNNITTAKRIEIEKDIIRFRNALHNKAKHKLWRNPKKKNATISATDNSCNPTYLILEEIHLNHRFFQHGFSKRKKARCTYSDLKQLDKFRTEKGFFECFKYDESFAADNPYCNGGKLIFGHKPLKKRINKITKKVGMNRILTEYCNKYHSNDNQCDFFLPSYELAIEGERNKFLTKHIDCNNDNSQYDNAWVFKEDTHAGEGIHFYNNHKLIYRLIVSDPSQNVANCSFEPLTNETFFIEEGIQNYYKTEHGYFINKTGLLIQKFVSNPLLLDINNMNHVFHLRHYWTIASYSDPVIILHYKRGLIEINPNEYNNKESMIDKRKVITNRHIVTMGQGVHGYEWSWGYTQLQQYLNRVYGDKLFAGKYTENKMIKDLKNVVQQIYRAYLYYNKKHNIKEDKLKYNELAFFQYCMDIIITDKFEIKLLEFNNNCGRPCEKKDLIQRKKMGLIYDWKCFGFREEITNILLEIFEYKSSNQSIKKINSLEQYEVAFWKQ